MDSIYRRITDELCAVAEAIDDVEVDRICGLIAKAGKVVVYGCGREALQIRGFAMRLYHLGLATAVAGDMTAPPVGKGDVLLVTSGPGELSTVLALMGEAKKAGAETIVLTAEAAGSAARQADHMLIIPAQTMASDRDAAKRSVLPMGSVYEGALFVLFEAMVLKLQALLAANPEAMRVRHTNLE